MRTLLFEPLSSGHRLQYAGLIAEALLELDHRVLFVTSNQAPSSPQWASFMNGVTSSIQLVVTDAPRNPTPTSLARWQSNTLQGVLDQHQPQHTYIPTADGVTQLAALNPLVNYRLRRSTSFIEALVLRAAFGYPIHSISDAAHRSVDRLSAYFSPWDLTHYVNPHVSRSAPDRVGSKALRTVMPEPVEQMRPVDPATARRTLGIPESGAYVVLPGAANRRKGADRLINLIAAGYLPKDVRLLLAGEVSRDIRVALDAENQQLIADGRIVVLDRFLTLEEFWLAIFSADVIALPYRAHVGSSGILVRAACAGRPVVASDFGWIGRATSLFGLGSNVDASSADSLGQAISTQLESDWPDSARETSREYVALNTIENFQEFWTRRIRQRST